MRFVQSPDLSDIIQEVLEDVNADYERAIDCYHEALDAAPDNVEILLGLGRVLRTHDRTQEALTVLEKAIAVDAGNAELLRTYGHALSELGREDDAIVSYRNALVLDAEALETAIEHELTLATIADVVTEVRRRMSSPDYKSHMDNIVRLKSIS